jgi:AAA family ATP:ADP antiporter
MLIGAGVLMLALSMTLMVDRIGVRRGSDAAEQADKTPLGPEGGFELIYRDRYLFWIAVLIVLLNVVNTTGQYILNRLIVSEAAAQFGTGAASVVASRQFVTAFSGSITAAVNLVGCSCSSLPRRGSSASSASADRCSCFRSSPWSTTR